MAIVYASWKATEENPKPDVSFVPPLERRRLTGVERAAFAVAHKVCPAGEVSVVFASRWGEIGTTLKLMRQRHDEGDTSPAAFAVSVHNATPGAWSLFTKNHASYTAIAARDKTFETGLLVALSRRERCLYVYAEESTPEFYRDTFESPVTAHSFAVLLDGSEDFGEIKSLWAGIFSPRTGDSPPTRTGDRPCQ